MSGALQNSSIASIARPMYGQPLFPPGGLPLDRTVQPAPQNWLARFLHIKPATKILCFQIGRMRALKEVSKAFKEWRRYGMKDVIVDKSNFRVFTRVDASNRKFTLDFMSHHQSLTASRSQHQTSIDRCWILPHLQALPSDQHIHSSFHTGAGCEVELWTRLQVARAAFDR